LLKKMTHVAFMTAAVCLTLTACSGGPSNSRLDYAASKPLPPLEVPPDLTAPSNTGLEEIPQVGGEGAAGTSSSGSNILPMAKGIHVEHDGAERWLNVNSSASALWPKLQEFWQSIGLELVADQPKVGIMETDWAENHANAPQGPFARLVQKVFKNAYEVGTRDKYRLRAEPREDGSTDLFITHYSLKQVVAGESEAGVETAWEVGPSKLELANEVMNRLILFLGGSKATATEVLAKTDEDTPPRAKLVGNSVVVSEGFARTWRRTGIALDKLGLVVDDRNRSQGIYYISKIDLLKGINGEDKSWFSSLFSSDKKQEESALKRQVLLQGDDSQTRLTVLDNNGERDTSKVALKILQRLQEELK